MSSSRFLVFTAVCFSALAGQITVAAAQSTSSNLETIAINDNRAAAGSLDGATLTVRLETREGEWHPDRDADPGIKVLAFALEGGPLQIPGPLIRVREGTEVRAFVRNRLEKEPLGSSRVVHARNRNGAGRPTRLPSSPVRCKRCDSSPALREPITTGVQRAARR